MYTTVRIHRVSTHLNQSVLSPENREASTHLPLLELVVVELLLVGDLLFGWRWQQLKLSLFGFSQQLLGGDLNLGRSFVLHLENNRSVDQL